MARIKPLSDYQTNRIVFTLRGAVNKAERVGQSKMELKSALSKLEIKTYSSIQEIKPEIWNQIASGRGFQSHCWYTFGERAMSDCPPTYLVAMDGETPVAGMALFKVKNEPLPLPMITRSFISSILKRRPLLVCRSPLADSSGLLLPGGPLPPDALIAITNTAHNELKRQRGSFLLFDFLPGNDLGWPIWHPGFLPITVSDPGTSMVLTHESFDAYLAANKKNRNDYHHTLRKAEENGLRLTRQTHVDDFESALALIDHVARKHNSPPNPWARGLLTNLSMIDGTWFEVRQGKKLVGCIVTMRDNRIQIATALGVEPDTPFVYFMLIYASIKEAFDQQVRQFRLGSGAYEVKRRLGFQVEDTNHAMVTASGAMARGLVRLVSTAGQKTG